MFNKLTTSLKQQINDFSLPELTLPSFDLPVFAWPQLTAAEYQTYAVLGFFITLLALEATQARAERRPRLYRQSYLANLGTFLLNDTLLSLLSVASLWAIAERFARWGVLRGLPDPFWKAVLSFLLLDLALYLWHRANHSFDWLWRFHKVHHSDPAMNVTTAFRLHIVEALLTMLVKALFIVVAGVNAAMVAAHEAIITVFVMFHHANLSFRGEHWLSRVFVVPFLHRVHHSARREEHDRNYGFVFSFWDCLFGTLAELKPVSVGLPNVEGMNMLALMKYGLVWQTTPPLAAANPSRASVESVLPNPLSLQAMIAEAAYYRAEKRGFAPGNERSDWLEAEREILDRRAIF